MTMKELLDRFSGFDYYATAETGCGEITVEDPDNPNEERHFSHLGFCPLSLAYREVASFAIEISDACHLHIRLEPATTIPVTVYCDTTRQFSDRECERDNLVDIPFPEHIVRAWFYGHVETNLDFEDWLNYFTADDTESLYDYAVSLGFKWSRPETITQFQVRLTRVYDFFVEARSKEEALDEAERNYYEYTNGCADESWAEIVDIVDTRTK